MPIRPELRKHYGPAWRALSRDLKKQAGWCCQKCGVEHGAWVYRAGLSDLGQFTFDLLMATESEEQGSSGNPPQGERKGGEILPSQGEHKGGEIKYQVCLTVAHLNHNPQDNRRENLRVWCQTCHLRFDIAEHVKNSAATRARKFAQLAQRAGQLDLI